MKTMLLIGFAGMVMMLLNGCATDNGPQRPPPGSQVPVGTEVVHTF